MTEERFIDLVRIEQVPLRRFLLALCSGDSATADDIAQDSLVRAYVASGSFKGLSSFRTWLFRIAYNCYIDHCRKTQPQRLPIDGREALNKTADDDPDHLFRFQNLYQAIDRLPEKEKAAVILFYFEDRSIKDDYGFMLEVLRRTSAFEGIKSEVDRQRKRWHKVLWITFFIGIAAGILIYHTFAFLDPRVCYTVAVIAFTITLVIVTTLDIKKQSVIRNVAKTSE